VATVDFSTRVGLGLGLGLLSCCNYVAHVMLMMATALQHIVGFVVVVVVVVVSEVVVSLHTSIGLCAHCLG